MHVEHTAQVDDLEHIQAQIAEILVDRLREFLAREGWNPRAIRAAPGADLGDDDEIIAIGRQRFPDDLVGDVRGP